MSTFNYTNEGQERPTESTFSDMQSLNKFTDEVSCAHFIFNSYNVFLVSSAKGQYARFGCVVSTAGNENGFNGQGRIDVQCHNWLAVLNVLTCCYNVYS